MSRLWLLVHSGLGGSCVFASRRDYSAYHCEMRRVINIDELKAINGLYAWSLLPACALMLVDVHASCADDERILAQLMTRLAVRHTCRKHGLTELPQALWSPSVSAVQIRADQVWEACRFVEIASVRTCLASTPGGWAWSSFHDARARKQRAHNLSQSKARAQVQMPECWESYLTDGLGRISQRVLSAGVTAGRVTYTRSA